MTRLSNYFLTIALVATALINTYGQAGQQISNLSFDNAYEAYRDSLKTAKYPWILPVMGAKVRKLGFDMPYPNGFMVNYAYSIMQITVENLDVGFSQDELTNVDWLARFQSIKPSVNAITARYDFWLLPFLNLSVIGGKTFTDTNVHLGLPFELKFQTQSEGSLVGWGTVIGGGVGPLVMTMDFTQAWTFIPDLDDPAKSIVFGARIGHMIRFPRKPQMNLVLLVGGQYLRLNPRSRGKADLEKLVGITPEAKQIALEQLDTWYGDLTGPEQELIEGVYNGLAGWLGNSESTTIYYEFNKRLYYPWSLSAGFNFQLNKRISFTSMYSFLGSREQFVFGVNYRFGLRGKNWLEGLTL